jgi:leader peptidase (prepilin peptidase)/N-methyltransferase
LIGIVFSAFVRVPDLFVEEILKISTGASGRWLWMLVSVCGGLLPAMILWGAGWLYEKVRHREGLGFGDVKLVAMVGTFLGMQNALLMLIVGSLAGSILGYGYIKATGKDAATYPLPFGTFLGAAALAVAAAGQKVLGWYTGQ